MGMDAVLDPAGRYLLTMPKGDELQDLATGGRAVVLTHFKFLPSIRFSHHGKRFNFVRDPNRVSVFDATIGAVVAEHDGRFGAFDESGEIVL